MAKLKKRADGRYQRRVTLPDGAKKVVYGKSEPEVNKKVKELEEAFKTGVELNNKITVQEWSLEWLTIYKSALKYNTKNVYLNALNTHIIPHIGDIQLKNVKAIHIQNIINSVSDKSESLQSKVLVTCRQLFRDARINHLVVFDPTEGIKIIKNTRDDKIKFISKEQQNQLIEAVTEPRAKAFCALCLYAGLRRAEALGMHWNDIDFENDIIHVNRALTFTKNQPDTDMSLKTKASNREIPLLSPLKEILLSTPQTSMFVVSTVKGGLMTKMSFKRLWAYVEKVIDFSLHPHMLRHPYVKPKTKKFITFFEVFGQLHSCP